MPVCTKTPAALRVYSDILEAVDSGDVAALVLLDRLHLILSTMPYCVDVCRCLMVCVALCWTGFSHICMGGPSMSDVALLGLQGHG